MLLAAVGICDIEAVADRHDERVTAHTEALDELAPKLCGILIVVWLDVQAIPEVIVDLLAVLVDAEQAHRERVGLVRDGGRKRDRLEIGGGGKLRLDATAGGRLNLSLRHAQAEKIDSFQTASPLEGHGWDDFDF